MRTAYATSARKSKVIGRGSPSTTTFTCAVLIPVALTFMVTGTSSTPGTPLTCAGISLPVISIVVHWHDGCAPNTFSGLTDVFTSLKLPSNIVCGATTPKSNPAGAAITLALAAGAVAARIGLPTGFDCTTASAGIDTTGECATLAVICTVAVLKVVFACALAIVLNTTRLVSARMKLVI